MIYRCARFRLQEGLHLLPQGLHEENRQAPRGERSRAEKGEEKEGVFSPFIALFLRAFMVNCRSCLDVTLIMLLEGPPGLLKLRLFCAERPC